MEFHAPQNKCRHEVVIKRLLKLIEINQTIPALLNANKEAVTMATNFQGLLKKADEAHGILMTILAKHGEVGETIKNEYLGEIDKWSQSFINQDIEEPKQGTEQSTLNETGDKPSIIMTDGKNSPRDF